MANGAILGQTPNLTDYVTTEQLNQQIASLNEQITQLNNRFGNYLALSGGTMTGSIAMSSRKITGLANGSASNDAVNYGQLTSAISNIPSGFSIGENFSNFTKITNITRQIPASSVGGGPTTLYSSNNQTILLIEGIIVPTNNSLVCPIYGILSSAGTSDRALYCIDYYNSSGPSFDDEFRRYGYIGLYRVGASTYSLRVSVSNTSYINLNIYSVS